MNEDEIARKLKFSKTKYLRIERGEEAITQPHLIQLADVYKRPLIAFYSTDVTTVPELPHDYRLNRDKKLSPEVFLAKSKAIYLAERLKEITGRTNSLPDININISAYDLSERIKKLLELDYKFLKELKDEPIPVIINHRLKISFSFLLSNIH